MEIGTNLKLNALYIADRRDEIQFLQSSTRIIYSILNRDIDERQKLGITKKRLEMMDAMKFENTFQERVQELKDCNNLLESNILINEIDTLESILGRLSDMKYGENGRAIEIAEAGNNFKRVIRLRKQLNKTQDLEDEIITKIKN